MIGADIQLIAALTRVQVADYVSTLLGIYTILILVRILLSWVPRMPQNPLLNTVVGFVEDVTEPYLALWRRIIPPISFSGGGIDISPIAAIFVLSIGGGILVRAIQG